MKRIENVREFVWKIIDTDIAIKKDLSRNLINTRALAKYIINEYRASLSIDAVVSAIRRYNSQQLKKMDVGRVYSLLRQAKIYSVTKVSSLTLRKTDEVHSLLGRLLPNTDYTRGEILRVIEGSRIFRIIFDQKKLPDFKSMFGNRNIVGENKKLGMLEIIYPDVLEKTPGVFSVISNELGENDISIIDALICLNEHIIILEEKSLLKAFDIVFNLCS